MTFTGSVWQRHDSLQPTGHLDFQYDKPSDPDALAYANTNFWQRVNWQMVSGTQAQTGKYHGQMTFCSQPPSEEGYPGFSTLDLGRSGICNSSDCPCTSGQYDVDKPGHGDLTRLTRVTPDNRADLVTEWPWCDLDVPAETPLWLKIVEIGLPALFGLICLPACSFYSYVYCLRRRGAKYQPKGEGMGPLLKSDFYHQELLREEQQRASERQRTDEHERELFNSPGEELNRYIEVTFADPKPAPLGLHLQEEKDSMAVAVTRVEGMAAREGVRVRDQIIEVNAETVFGQDLDHVLSVIRRSSRPLHIVFLRKGNREYDGDGGDLGIVGAMAQQTGATNSTLASSRENSTDTAVRVESHDAAVASGAGRGSSGHSTGYEVPDMESAGSTGTKSPRQMYNLQVRTADGLLDIGSHSSQERDEGDHVEQTGDDKWGQEKQEQEHQETVVRVQEDEQKQEEQEEEQEQSQQMEPRYTGAGAVGGENDVNDHDDYDDGDDEDDDDDDELV